MSVWGDSALLVELLDRQFEYLLKLNGIARLLRLPRLLAFLEREPSVAGLLQDFHEEANDVLASYDNADKAIRTELADLWSTHETEVRGLLSDVEDDALFAYGRMTDYANRLEGASPAVFPNFGVPSEREQGTERLILALQHWSKWAVQHADERGGAPTQELRALDGLLSRLRERCEYSSRRIQEASSTLPWPAFVRLGEHANVTNPIPPASAGLVDWVAFNRDSEFATALRRADVGDVSPSEKEDVETVYDATKADAMLLHEELRARIGLGRTRLAIVRRYAARAEAFDARRLRAACDSDTRNAERILTLDFARYMFDAGLNPLIDATVGGLRPDVLHVASGSLFYVEAKQYADEHPSSRLADGYAQVWGTWARLRKTFDVPEAFLVVFRRGGPWVELPPVIHHEGLRLYTVVADISEEGGSKEKLQPVSLTAEQLRPRSEPP